MLLQSFQCVFLSALVYAVVTLPVVLLSVLVKLMSVFTFGIKHRQHLFIRKKEVACWDLFRLVQQHVTANFLKVFSFIIATAVISPLHTCSLWLQVSFRHYVSLVLCSFSHCLVLRHLIKVLNFVILTRWNLNNDIEAHMFYTSPSIFENRCVVKKN